MLHRSASPLLLAVALGGTAQAQFNDRWARFVAAPDAIVSAAAISDDSHETDLAWADLDGDGDIDLVAVRKQPFTTSGDRTNLLLVNEGGVLTDRSAELASASDVPGDLGFLTPTNDRDVVIADVDGDGFPDVITAVDDLGADTPKWLSHPRVYRNLGGSGAWGGLRFEAARTPQIFHATSGVPLDPRFVAVDAGDFDNDGSIDLYFGDNDTGATLFGPLEPAAEDSDDRMLFNDGLGFFTDVSATAMTPGMLVSGFCNSVATGDFNSDGTLDLLKQASYVEVAAKVAYNDPGNPGQFVFQPTIYPVSPYFVNAGDLNSDGRLDVAITSNGADRYLVNLGPSTTPATDWSAPGDFELLVGEKVGFTYASNNLIADLDGDGWGEILIADIDPEIPDYAEGKRTRIYHNRGGSAPGASDFVMREERASVSDDDWIGVDGLSALDLRWTHDVAVFDVNSDGRQDLVLSRREGTQVWLGAAPATCQVSLDDGAGEPVLEVCGGDLSRGTTAVLRLFAAPPAAASFLVAGLGANPVFLPDFGITLTPNPVLFVLPFATDAAGGLALPIPGGGGPVTLVGQVVVADGGGFAASNSVQLELLP